MAVYSWGHERRFNDYASYIKRSYGERVQKISVNVGFSCPNRDGSKGRGGCIYCDNNTFKPGYCEPEISVSEQIKKGIAFFDKKYPDRKYFAYFQSYTNTYAPVADLEKLYREALSHPKVIGLVIGTRPDCINAEIMQMLAGIQENYPVTIEFGVESTYNATLKEINRCHSYEETREAIRLCQQHGIQTGAHLILGLPGESREMILSHAERISELPIHSLKLHQLQITRNTILAKRYADDPAYVKLFTFEEYLDLVIQFVEKLHPGILLERFVSTSPLEKLVAPRWNNLKNFDVVHKIEQELAARDTWQGRLYKKNDDREKR